MEYTPLRLDDLYYMTVHIYSEQNEHRPPSTTFAHFVEVCGMLATYDRKKKRESFNVEDALCKALGWYFPLLAKFKISSVEELIFRKYPYACPYCRRSPHNDLLCKTVRGASPTVNHAALEAEYRRNLNRRPHSLTDWQAMFQHIYPRAAHDAPGRSTLGLFEELGELAEAIRVFDRHPKYFLGEAADVSSYLMGLASEYSLMVQMDQDREFSLEAEYMKRYPGLCTQCGNQVCSCPSIPDATVGRMAKELNLQKNDAIFLLENEVLHTRGREVSSLVFTSLGRSTTWSKQLPFDRGEANGALVEVLKRLAIETDDPNLKNKLQDAAVKVEAEATFAGSGVRPTAVAEVVKFLQDAWPDLALAAARIVPTSGDLPIDVMRLLLRVRILLVLATPKDIPRLELDVEERAIREAIKISRVRDFISITTLPAATTDDLRRALLEREYDVIHFSGHGTAVGPIFSDLSNSSIESELEALSALIRRYATIKCVILNSCWSLAGAKEPLADFTVGMAAPVEDRAAIEFARGFYDALGAGRDFGFAIEEGKSAVDMKGLKAGLPIIELHRPQRSSDTPS